MPSYSAGSRPGLQSNYGAGLGTIYQFGHQNPLGPYSMLQQAQGANAGRPTVGSSTTTASSGLSDPASAFFNDVLAGRKLPYDQATQDSMYATASDMSAAAEAANLQQATAAAQRGGASANDPSLQGRKLGLQSQRQAQNIKSKQDLTNKANLANFGAQTDAANAMQQANFEQQRINAGNMQSLMPYSRGGQGGGSSGGNNFTGSGFLQFQNANLGDFRSPQTAARPQSGPASWSEADWEYLLG